MADNLNFAALLDAALTEPGTLSRAYFAFHNYSLGNQMLALLQCEERGIPLGPINTFKGWLTLNRCVRRGEKALTLCMPITFKKRSDADAPDDDDDAYIKRFVYRPRWFALAQTDGEAYVPLELPTWNRARALAALEITEEPFAMPDGNCQGYARARCVAVSPIAAHPLKTLFHEMAHVLHGHTAEADMTDGTRTPRTIREVEAEAVAMLCGAALGLPGVEDSRGYIQHWYRSREPLGERICGRIFKVADQILRAGRPAASQADIAAA